MGISDKQAAFIKNEARSIMISKGHDVDGFEYEITPEIGRFFSDMSQMSAISGKASPRFGAVITGEVGTGKDLAFQILSRIISEKSKINNTGRTELVKTISLNELRARISCGDLEKFFSLSESLNIVIEDITKERSFVMNHGNRIDIVSSLIEDRYRNKFRMFTGFTTNMSVKDFVSGFGERAKDRMIEGYEFYLFKKRFRNQ